MTRQELQQVQAQRNAVLGQDPDDPNWGIKPANAMTEADVDAAKAGTNGEIVQLADQKVQPSPVAPVNTPTTQPAAVTEKQPAADGRAAVPDTKATMPGVQVDGDRYAVRKGMRDLADKVMGLEDINRILAQYNPQKTTEEIEAEKRKEKRDNLLAKIGDGLSSFHEAYSHMRGVQPMTNGTSLTGRMRERRERMDRERQALDSQRMAMAMNLANLKLKQRAADDTADYRQAQTEYWASQAERWRNEAKVAQQRADEQARANKARETQQKENEEGRNKRAEERNAVSLTKKTTKKVGRASTKKRKGSTTKKSSKTSSLGTNPQGL